jgi:predicted GNAT family acetyltransferase
MGQVVDNQARNRFELEEQGLTAFADYVRRGSVLSVPHVEAPPALRGTGAAGRLMEGMLALLRARGEGIEPLCPYADAYIRRHKQWADLVR